MPLVSYPSYHPLPLLSSCLPSHTFYFLFPLPLSLSPPPPPPPPTSFFSTFPLLSLHTLFSPPPFSLSSPSQNAHPDVPPLKVMHYHFLGWPDHGVPKFATSLIAFIRRVRKEHNKDGPPMLVHCSAGVGRTGTYILLDSMLERMKAEETVNVYEYLRNMRAKRVFMVQTLVSCRYSTCLCVLITKPILRLELTVHVYRSR